MSGPLKDEVAKRLRLSLYGLAMVDLRAQPSCFEMIGHGNTQKLCLKGSLRMLKNNLLMRKEFTNERG